MRTKEKFYTNLSKFQVSEKKVERFEFKDIKTLDSLDSKAEGMIKKLSDAYNDYTEFRNLDDEEISVEQSKERLEKEKQNIKMYEEDLKQAKEDLNFAKQELKFANDDFKTETKTLNTSQKTLATRRKLHEKNTAKYKKVASDARKIANDFNTNIKAVDKAAQALGVSVNISDYKSTLDKLEGEIVDV